VLLQPFSSLTFDSYCNRSRGLTREALKIPAVQVNRDVIVISSDAQSKLFSRESSIAHAQCCSVSGEKG
jgi:hypothetical protein